MSRIRPQTGFETTLTASISASSTTIPVTTCPTETVGFMVIEPGTANKEVIKYTGSSNPGGAGNLTGVTRGLTLVGSSVAGGTGTAHAAGQPCNMTNTHHYLEQLAALDDANIFTATSQKFGPGSAGDVKLYAHNGDTNEPFLQWDDTNNKWLISNDGTSTYDITSGGSGLSAGDEITISGSAINNDAAVRSFTAGEAIQECNALYYKSSDNKVYNASASSAGTTNTFIGFARSAAAIGDSVKVQFAGIKDMTNYSAVKTIVNDSFTRADSNTVGGVWTENNETGADDLKISSNKVQLGKVGLNSIATLTATHPIFDNASDAISMSFKFQVASNPSAIRLFVGMFSTTAVLASKTGVMLKNGTTNNVQSWTNGAAVDTANFTINTGTDYYCWIDLVPNGSNVNIAIYLSTTSTKPGAATITSNNQVYAATNSLVNFGADSTNDGIWYFDDVVVTFTPTALTAGTLYYLSNAPGRIKTSAGSTSKKVGRTLSSTLLLIKNDNE